MKRTIAAVLMAATLLGTTAGTANAWVARKPLSRGPIVLFGCQYDVFHGRLSAQGFTVAYWPNGVVTSGTDATTGRTVSVLVTNNAHTKSYELHSHTTHGLYQHAIFPTYTQRNAKVWISGHRCEGT